MFIIQTSEIVYGMNELFIYRTLTQMPPKFSRNDFYKKLKTGYHGLKESQVSQMIDTYLESEIFMHEHADGHLSFDGMPFELEDMMN